MSEGPKKLGRGCLVSELAVWTLYAFFVLAYDLSLPPAVGGASRVVAHAATCVIIFAAILGLLNLSIRQSNSGHRIRGLVLLAAVVLAIPVLLLISFPQY